MSLLIVGSDCWPPSGSSILNFTFDDHIQLDLVANQNATVTEIRIDRGAYGPTSRGAIKFKAWRDVGANYEFVGQSEPLFPLSHTLNSSNCFVMTINSTFVIQSGDILGYNWPPRLGNNLAHLNFGTFPLVPTTVRQSNSDPSTTQLKTDYPPLTPVDARIGIDFFGSAIITPPNQASSLVRAKNPDTGDVISFLTDYDFSTGGFQTIKSYRSLTGNLHSQQINNFRRFEIPLVQINSQNINFLRSWKADRIRLNFTENHSESNVDSGFLVVITELNINKFKKPYSQNLWTGNIVVETI